MSVNGILQLVFIVIIIMSFPLALQWWINSRVRGKHLCFIVEKGRPLSIKLLKIIKDDFVKEGKDHWILDNELMKPVDYPIQFPKVLAGFQKGVWASLVMRGRASPLDWENPPAGALSSKEVPAILDPHWLIALVRGVGEEGKPAKSERMLLYLAVGASVICLVMLFYVISKLGGIQAALDAFMR
jgi:hypothetical protein